MKKTFTLLLFTGLFALSTRTSAQLSLNLGGAGNRTETTYDLDLINGFTIEYNVNLNSLTGYNGLVGKGCTYKAAPIDSYISSTGIATVFFGNCTFTGGNPSFTFSTGTWYHIAITFDPTVWQEKFYVDGNLIATYTATDLANGTDPLMIGNRPDFATDADAQFDNVRIWSGVRTATQILDYKDACLTGNETGLEILYTMEEGSGTVLNDLALNNGAQNATIVGTVTWGAGPTPIAPVISSNPSLVSICVGDNATYSITATPALSYQWQVNTGSGFSNITDGGVYSNATTSTLSITGATAGMNNYIYQCIATNGACGSATSNMAYLAVSNPSIANGTSTSATCNGACDGSATVSGIAGGLGGYMFSWSPSGGNAATAASLCAGTYTCTVTDNAGCSATKMVTVLEPSALNTATSQNNLNCNGDGTGNANVSVSGGTSGYTFLWSNSATTSNISGLSAGSYTCTITDANSCQATATVTITEPPVFTATGTYTDITCNGANDGTATATPSGGTNPMWSWEWSNSGTPMTITDLAPGTYSCTITDANFCTATTTVTINEPSLITATSAFTDISCNGSVDGTATAVPSGGTTPYIYSWNNGATTATVVGLAAGTYSCTITDVNSCPSATVTVTINEPTVLTATSTNTHVTCNGGADGTATATPSGGTSPYTYLWTNFATTATAVGLMAGTYTCTITDANLCTTTITETITEPGALSVMPIHFDVTCNGGSDGSASMVIYGATGSYTYLWSNSATTSSLVDLSAGSYTCTITDMNGCTVTGVASVSEPPAITGSQTLTLCSGSSVTVGSNVYSATGVYTDVLTAASGCDSTVTTDLTVNAAIDVSTTLNAETITANASSASYQWIDCNNTNSPINGATNQFYTASVNGDYAVIVTVNSCSDTSVCTNINTIGFNKLNSFVGISIYPNPSEGIFTINLKEKQEIEVVNTLGESVLKEIREKGISTLDLTSQANGIYFVSVKNNNTIYRIKITKEK